MAAPGLRQRPSRRCTRRCLPARPLALPHGAGRHRRGPEDADRALDAGLCGLRRLSPRRLGRPSTALPDAQATACTREQEPALRRHVALACPNGDRCRPRLVCDPAEGRKPSAESARAARHLGGVTRLSRCMAGPAVHTARLDDRRRLPGRVVSTAPLLLSLRPTSAAITTHCWVERMRRAPPFARKMSGPPELVLLPDARGPAAAQHALRSS